MRKKFNHIAIIPARKNSKSLPKKNRFLFKHTAEFLNNNNLFHEIYVNSDDLFLKKVAKNYGFNFYKRKEKFAKDNTCIKDVFVEMKSMVKFPKNTFIWLFYIPIVYKNLNDFKEAIKLVEKNNLKSICSFKKAETHPMSCWFIKKNKPVQFIKNNIFRRQDLIDAYSHHHYICGFNIKILDKLNNELIYKNTYPLILNNKVSNKLLEIDTYEEMKKFKEKSKKL